MSSSVRFAMDGVNARHVDSKFSVAGVRTWAAVIMVGTKDAFSFLTLSDCIAAHHWQ